MAASPATPPPGVPSRLHNFGMAPDGSAAGEVPAYTQPQSLRKDDAEVIAEREQALHRQKQFMFKFLKG